MYFLLMYIRVFHLLDTLFHFLLLEFQIQFPYHILYLSYLVKHQIQKYL